jgi:hypothetical protein
MISFRESRISAHHNYLVNDMLTPGFLVGDPHGTSSFYFLGDLVLPGERTARISCRLLNGEGRPMATLHWNRIVDNPAGCVRQPAQNGFVILGPEREPILEVRTETFANGFLTKVRARLSDEEGALRVEPMGESIQVHGPAQLVLEEPFA